MSVTPPSPILESIYSCRVPHTVPHKKLRDSRPMRNLCFRSSFHEPGMRLPLPYLCCQLFPADTTCLTRMRGGFALLRVCGTNRRPAPALFSGWLM